MRIETNIPTVSVSLIASPFGLSAKRQAGGITERGVGASEKRVSLKCSSQLICRMKDNISIKSMFYLKISVVYYK